MIFVVYAGGGMMTSRRNMGNLLKIGLLVRIMFNSGKRVRISWPSEPLKNVLEFERARRAPMRWQEITR